MKVVQIVTQMEAAGAQKVAFLLHEGLKSRVEDAQLWFLYTKRPAYSCSDGVDSLFERPPKSPEYGVIAGRLHRRLKEIKPDVLITHTHYSNVLGHTIAQAVGVPQRIAVHHNPLHTYPSSVRVWDRFLGGSGAYTGVVAVSDAVASTFESHPETYRRRLTTIRNGWVFAAHGPAKGLRARWGIPEGAPLLVNVGRLSKQKNQGLLLSALANIPDAHLAIVGGGERREELENLSVTLKLTDRVHFTGEVPPETVAAFLAECDAFVFPSLWEGLPMAAIEALHAGAAIVASDIPATREVCEDAALLVPPDDAAALAEAVRKLLGDPALERRLRSRAGGRAALFSADCMIDRYFSLISGEMRREAGLN